jgi:PncC family amidohydrolase
MIYHTPSINKIKNYLLKHKETIAVAESVSCGHLQAALSTAEDASMFFQGGITAFNIGQKCRHLDVEPIYADECDCVSQVVSDAMARGVIKMFVSDYGISLTGYATKVPEVDGDNLYAFYSVIKKGKLLSKGKILYRSKEYGFAAQVFYTNELLKKFALIFK